MGEVTHQTDDFGFGADVDAGGVAIRLRMQLQDGTPVAVDLAEPRLRIAAWMPAVLGAQLLLLAALCAFAVRQVTRPLDQLASAATALAPGQPAVPLPETGPREVAQASGAFNRMRARIEQHLGERTQMLAAISHDLQTPITRLRLRADLLADAGLRDRFLADLAQMQHLVEQGLAFARSAQPLLEPEVTTDIGALLQSLVDDYQDAAQPVRWLGGPPCIRPTRPQALRRAVGNLIDNAIKFGGGAEVALAGDADQALVQVLDRGPGIPADELDKVLQPFYRIDGARNTATGGSGLGLAIVQRLLVHCRAELRLQARAGGGVEACIRI